MNELENQWQQKAERIKLLTTLYYQTCDESYRDEAEIIQLDQAELEKKIARSI